MEFGDVPLAHDFLSPFLPNAHAMQELRELLVELDTKHDLSQLTDGEIIDEVAWAICTHQLEVTLIPEARPASVSLPKEEATPLVERPGEPAEAPLTYSITFRVIDDETEEPIEGVKLKIKLPTGEVGEHTTDSDGTIEIKDLPDGACDIQRMEDDEAFEVVKVA